MLALTALAHAAPLVVAAHTVQPGTELTAADLYVAQVHGHRYSERRVAGETDFVVALVKESHGVDLTSWARSLVIMTCIACRVR